MQRKNKADPPLTYVREIGFDNTLGVKVDGHLIESTEHLFFIDTLGNTSFNATDEAILGAIQRLKHTVETLELYLKNGRNNATHEWE